MANNYECGTVSPYFPTKIVKKFQNQFPNGISLEPAEGGQLFTYLYIEDGCEDWDDFAKVLQKMLVYWQEKGNDAPKYCYYKVAYYCDKMRQDEFGGFCCFVTAKNLTYSGVDQFIMDCIRKQEKGWLE